MKNKLILKVTLLSVSLIAASAAAINGNIPTYAEAFLDIPLSAVEMLSTLPSLFLMVSVLCSTHIAKKIGYKQTITIGIGLVSICGMIPVFSNDFYLILASRGLFGFGVGLFNSLIVSVISHFYEGKELAKMIGFQSSFEGLGGLFVTFISGQLLTINWHASFLAYGIAFPILFLFLTIVPKISTKEILEQSKDKIIYDDTVNIKNKSSFWIVIGYTILIFIIAILFMTMGIKVAGLVQSLGYGKNSDGSLVIMMVSVGSMLSGFLFGRILSKLKNFTICTGLALLSLAMLILGMSNSIIISGMASALVGFSFRMILPFLIHKVNSDNIKNNGLATSLILVGFNLGIAVCPYASIILESIAWDKSPRGIFYIDAILLFIIALISLATIFYFSKIKQIEYCK